jgi:hypothetical protein
MDAKHTPGPWQIIPYPDGHSFIREGDAPERFVANVSGHNYEANARLIAAAPDMLEALRLLMAATQFITFDRDSNIEYAEARDHARAAIVKATGEPK